MKIQKKNYGGGGGRGCRGGSGWGVRVDVNEELKFLGRIQKKKLGGGGSGGVGGRRVGSGGTGLGCQGGCE